MARLKRIDLPHTLYHVMSRTNSGDLAFLKPGDYRKFLGYLKKYLALFEFRLHAYCLLPNHFHLILESGEKSALSELMRRLLTAYTVYFNRKHSRHGHLFQGRFKSLVVEKSDYLLALSQYIHTNPQRLSPPHDPFMYEWSSLSAYLEGSAPPWLHTAEILAWFENNPAAYGRFIREGLNEQTKPLVMSRRFIGGEAFVRRWRERAVISDKARRRDCADESALGISDDSRHQADRLLSDLAARLEVTPEVLLSTHARNGLLSDAKTFLVNLLRDYTPWTCEQIALYAHLHNAAAVRYHLHKMHKNDNLQIKYRKICQNLGKPSAP